MKRRVADTPEDLPCVRCGQQKPVSEFSVITRQGQQCYYSYCKPCKKSYRPEETRKSARRIMGQAPEELSCARCEQNKPLSGFAIRTLKGVVRYHSYCKDCENKYARDFRAKDREATKKKDRAYYKANRERILASSRRYRVETGFNRKQHLKRYNLTPDEYQVLLVKQNGVCAICRRPPWGKRNVLMVDHDHETGKVRGLLCSTCNVGLGALHDDAELLRVAIAYLEGG